MAAALEAADGDLPVYVGVGGNSTRHMAEALAGFEALNLAGCLVVAPHCNRPTVDGIAEHCRVAAGQTGRTAIVCNAAYRTGVSLPDDALFELAARRCQHPGGEGCDRHHRPEPRPAGAGLRGPRCHPGADPYLVSLASGAAGGVLAAAHVTRELVTIHRSIEAGELGAARALWRGISPLIPRLSQESSPLPLTYCLRRLGLIRSAECWLPLTRVSAGLAAQLDEIVAPWPGGPVARRLKPPVPGCPGDRSWLAVPAAVSGGHSQPHAGTVMTRMGLVVGERVPPAGSTVMPILSPACSPVASTGEVCPALGAGSRPADRVRWGPSSHSW